MSIPELKIAEQLFSKKRLETGAVRRETTILQGTALSDSEDGYVAVDYPGNVTVGETAEIRIPTGPAVKAGDSVEISLTGGTGKSPMVSNVPGWGDRQQQQIDLSLTAYTDDSTYYLLSSTVPSTPTDETWEVAGWSTTEPVWAVDDNRTLYMSRRIELVDGTVTWSTPAEVTSNASLEVARNAILAQVSDEYSTISSTRDAIDGLRTYTNSIVQLASDNLTTTFTTSIDSTNSDVDAAAERISTIEKSFEISASGVTIKASESSISAVLDNDGLDFKSGDEVVLSLNAETSTASADRFSVGPYQWREMGSTAIALVWIGG